MRRLEADGLVNARDLGGLSLVGGGTTPRGVFFRSESVETVTARGWKDIHRHGIRTVVDLRQQGERELDESSRPDWLTTVHVDLDGLENTDFWRDFADNGLWGTPVYFLPHLAAMPERAGGVLTALANATPGGVLFHCQSGRDRTGMVAMVLLSLVRTESEAIVDDYLETVRRADALAAVTGRENDEHLREAILARRGSTTEKSFREVLAHLDVEAFLSAARLSEHVVSKLRTWRGALDNREGS